MRARARRVSPRTWDATPSSTAALGASLREGTRHVLSLLPNLPRETAGILDNVRESGALADLIASNFAAEQASVADKQKILETFEPKARVRAVLSIVNRQLELLRVKSEVTTMIADEGKAQREQILRQQMRTIKEELGEGARKTRSTSSAKLPRAAGLPDEVQKVARKQLGRLSAMQSQSAEYNVTRTYLEWLSDVPWSARPRPDKLDIEGGRAAASTKHHSWAREDRKSASSSTSPSAKLAGSKKAPILCFIGPPGVGKTSLESPPSRARWGAATTASPSAACETRPRSGGIGAPTSAPSPAASSRR